MIEFFFIMDLEGCDFSRVHRFRFPCTKAEGQIYKKTLRSHPPNYHDMSKGRLGLKNYIIRRVLQFVPLFFVILILTYGMVLIAPGDPVFYLVGTYGASEEYLEKMRSSLGLDRPWYEQLIGYISRVLRGDLGYSLYFRKSVSSVILIRFPITILLMGVSFLCSSVVGIFLGIEASRRPFSIGDRIISSFSTMGYSMPIFLTGMILILIFSIILGWLPSGGYVAIGQGLTGLSYVVSILRHLILPAIALSTYLVPLVASITRTSMLEAIRSDFITTARMKGLSERTVVYKHAFRNALLPIVTILSLQLGHLVAGATLTETVFSWPGIGRLTFDSIWRRDWPTLLGILVFVSVLVMIINLVTDILYAYIDPRITYGKKR